MIEPETEPDNDLVRELAWTKYLDLDSPGYDEIHCQLQGSEHVAPLVYVQGNQEVTMIASRHMAPNGEPQGNHDYNPDSVYHTDLDKVFAHYLATTLPDKQVGIIEGTISDHSTRDVAIRNGTESGHLAFIAEQNNMEIISGEPSEAELHQELFNVGVTTTELAALYTIWSLGSLVRREGSLDNLGPHMVGKARQADLVDIEIPDESARSTMSAEQVDALRNDLNNQAVQLIPQLNEALGKEWFCVRDGLPALNLPPEAISDDAVLERALADAWWPNRLGRINEVSRLTSDVRDKHLFKLITDQVKAGKSPIVPFGSTHVARLKPCLDTYLGSEPAVLDVASIAA